MQILQEHISVATRAQNGRLFMGQDTRSLRRPVGGIRGVEEYQGHLAGIELYVVDRQFAEHFQAVRRHDDVDTVTGEASIIGAADVIETHRVLKRAIGAAGSGDPQRQIFAIRLLRGGAHLSCGSRCQAGHVAVRPAVAAKLTNADTHGDCCVSRKCT